MGISDTAKDDLVDHFEAGDISTIVDHFLPSVSDTKPVPNVLVDRHANACFRAAIQAESFIAQVTDYAVLTSILKSAESLLQDAARHAPEWADATEAIARNLWFQGRHNDALEMFGRAAKQRQEMARLAGWDPEAMVFLPRNCAQVIGLMGHIDAFVKYKMLTGDPRPYLFDRPEARGCE